MREAMGGGGVRHHIVGLGYLEFRLEDDGQPYTNVSRKVLLEEVQKAFRDLERAVCARLLLRALDLGGSPDV